MASGFGLPVLNLQQAIAGIGTAYDDAYDKSLKKSALTKLGSQFGAGDYTGAASTAFDAGDPAVGVNLLKLGAERSKEQRQAANSAALFGSGGGGLPDVYGGGGSGMGPLGSAVRSDASPGLPSFADAAGPSGDYVSKLFTRESANNPLARASNSSALGLGQFTTSTWLGMRQAHPELGLTPDGRTDPAQMRRATEAFTSDNGGILSRAGLPVNDATLYATHFLGQGGGPRFVRGAMSNPDAPAASYANPDQVAANRSIFFNRDGSPRSAGEVLNEFTRSFGGGRPAQAMQRPAPRVDVAETEDDVQRLESRMGQPPVQAASADLQSDMPAVGTSPAALSRVDGMNPGNAVPPGIGGDGRLRVVPPVTGAGGASVAVPMLREPGASGEAPQQVAQARTGVPAANDAGGTDPLQRRLAAMPATARVSYLLRASALDLPEQQRGVVKELLSNALQEARMPDGVKEFLWARANGMTQARTPGEYQREAKGPQVVGPGSSMYDTRGNLIATAPDRSRTNVADDVGQRKDAALSLGLEPGSPGYQSYVLTGKMPREDAQPLTALDKKAIQDADTAVLGSRSTIDMLKDAKALSKQAYAGPFAGKLGYITSMFGDERGIATQNLDNLITTQALQQLKATFGAAPTEGERAILLEIQGASSKPDPVRQKIYDRAIGLAEIRARQNQEKADELRGLTYYKPGGGGTRSAGAASSSGAPALPRPTPSNRPGAVSAGDRFGQLVGSGMSREQAYQQLQSEGY